MKIMLVEDDEALAGEIGSFLRRWGYETVEARHFDRIGEEFSQQMPQLVLMDINLPFYVLLVREDSAGIRCAYSLYQQPQRRPRQDHGNGSGRG